MTYARRYTQAQSETASPERLMVLLFDAGLRHMHTAATALEAGRTIEAEPSLTRAGEIVTELMCTLDPSHGAGDLCETLTDLYQFVNARLLEASAQRDPGKARDAARVFAPIAEGFREAVARLQAQRGAEAR
jgi:flagellar protein FliS